MRPGWLLLSELFARDVRCSIVKPDGLRWQSHAPTETGTGLTEHLLVHIAGQDWRSGSRPRPLEFFRSVKVFLSAPSCSATAFCVVVLSLAQPCTANNNGPQRPRVMPGPPPHPSQGTALHAPRQHYSSRRKRRVGDVGETSADPTAKQQSHGSSKAADFGCGALQGPGVREAGWCQGESARGGLLQREGKSKSAVSPKIERERGWFGKARTKAASASKALRRLGLAASHEPVLDPSGVALSRSWAVVPTGLINTKTFISKSPPLRTCTSPSREPWPLPTSRTGFTVWLASPCARQYGGTA
ncbi:hypothetical protein CC78DRAFT_575736 [Lojkania enalia]|uniref:Uncharacterized protein n=1 Tax=Lojkania enalia TaxID=147567 RepID=A0A9P4N8C8_9PLEO|nr:hypothetical protein CC78DRAFT_575736 [Didymosphaeria enalia]